jgi:hypothetical protein
LVVFNKRGNAAILLEYFFIELAILFIKLINDYDGKISMRVLVTIGAGYISSHICDELLEAGHDFCHR